MTVNDFIKKAYEGGWEFTPIESHDWKDGLLGKLHQTPLTSVFLDTKAWIACGKVEGWKIYNCRACDGKLVKSCGIGSVAFPLWCSDCHNYQEGKDASEWQKNMHRMIDALAEGKSLEQFLETL